MYSNENTRFFVLLELIQKNNQMKISMKALKNDVGRVVGRGHSWTVGEGRGARMAL